MAAVNLIDLTGQRFGRWVVIERDTGSCGKVRWRCRCDCGVFASVQANHLASNATRSCGCARFVQGGKSTRREYGIWSKMIDRCHRRSNSNYRFYGAIGVLVCERWLNSFKSFLEDMGDVPSRLHTLDRKNTQGSYTCGKCSQCQANRWPSNCRWASKAEQARNQKSNRYYTHDGKTLILKDWARLVGVKYITLWNRLNVGMAFADAISFKRYDRAAHKRAMQKRS